MEIATPNQPGNLALHPPGNSHVVPPAPTLAHLYPTALHTHLRRSEVLISSADETLFSADTFTIRDILKLGALPTIFCLFSLNNSLQSSHQVSI
ncbi:hypothetical protein BGX38DRAFT_461858 [Terfezia claveryi]|nr:hypothetical protein BGX38DRAFT_461858 [Terfezia claveryi]